MSSCEQCCAIVSSSEQWDNSRTEKQRQVYKDGGERCEAVYTGEEGRVVGMDSSPGMLYVAK